MKDYTELNFPEWKIQFGTIKKLNTDDINKRKKILRNAASNFIKRKDVRNMIFSCKGNKCYICGANATQIDHKISALQFAINKKFDYTEMNKFDNLFPICASCNAAKKP